MMLLPACCPQRAQQRDPAACARRIPARCSADWAGESWRCICPGSRSRSCSMMSCRTRRVALAVNAAMGLPGNAARRRLSCRYSGRNSWPHSEMQCASSMAKNETGTRCSHSRCPSRASRSGERYSRRYFPARASRSRATARRCERAVQQRRGNSHLRQLRDLVLHQRDQRRNHDDGLVRRAWRPAIGSTATCRRRWASPRKRRGRPAGCARSAPAADETRRIPSSGASRPAIRFSKS